MDRDELFAEIQRLRAEGKSIRTIAKDLRVHRSTVARALKILTPASGQEVVPRSTSASSPGRLSQGVFVGRQREMAELQGSLGDALRGHGQVVMLIGEPGIGKTRTARELASYAETRNLQVLWGSCYEEAGAPPYWPWVQPLRTYIQQQDPEQLRSEMGPGAADIAEIIPDLQAKLPGLERPPSLEPEQARFRLLDSTTTFLKNAAWTQPLMLVLEDLHWADRSSLLLLEFLAHALAETPLLLVGTYRDVEVSRRHPLAQSLGSLVREPSFHRLQLSGLSEQEVGQFIEAAGVSPAPGLVEAVHARTEGNPLFVSEVARLLRQEGIDGGRSWSSRIPEGVRDAIGRRLSRLSEICNQVLIVASVVGREFDFRLLETLEVAATDQLMEGLEEALTAHVIEEVGQLAGRYQFSHALVHDTLLEELSLTRRVRLHARIGEALEELYGANAEDHAAELAYHFGQAEGLLGPEKVVKYSLLAGERALGAHAPEQGLAHFQRALAAKEGQPMDADTAALLFGIGRAQVATLERHQLQIAVDTLTRAFDYYLKVGEVERAVAVAEYNVPEIVGITGATRLIARALALVPPYTRQEGHILCRYADVLGITENNYEGAKEALSRATEIATRDDDMNLEMWTLAHGAQVDRYHARYQECLKKSLRTIELARLLDDPYAQLWGGFPAAWSLACMGDLHGARMHAEPLIALAERLRDRQMLENALMIRGAIAQLAGDWRSARACIDRILAAVPGSAFTLGFRAMLEYQLGELSQGQVYLDRLLGAMNLAPPGPSHWYTMPAIVIPVVARITGDINHFDTAQAAAGTVLSSLSAVPAWAITARTGLAIIAAQTSNTQTAAEQYAALESVRDTVLLFGHVSADRILGLLAHTMGRLDTAMTHFEDALAFCHKAGYRPELAWTCCDYADTLLQRNVSGDRPRAKALLEGALAISQELGMRPLAERVLARLDLVEAGPGGVPAYPDGLTKREVEVLRLIALGKTNRQLAEGLFISINTVERHVSNILAKTGAVNRTDATGYALRNNMLS